MTNKLAVLDKRHIPVIPKKKMTKSEAAHWAFQHDVKTLSERCGVSVDIIYQWRHKFKNNQMGLQIQNRLFTALGIEVLTQYYSVKG